MPRAKKVTQAETAAAEEEVEQTTTKRKRGRPAKVKAEAAEETPTKRRRGRPAKSETEPVNGKAKQEKNYDWKKVEVEPSDALTLGEQAPRGKQQISLTGFLESRGRKKTTVAMAQEHLESEGVPNGYADYVIRNAIHRGVLEV